MPKFRGTPEVILAVVMKMQFQTNLELSEN